MSKDIIILTPNGRRQKVHCSPDTNMLQVLEDVCEKQGFQAKEYALKHHNHLLDLSTSLRFSNLPNKATLEMVESAVKREETPVTIGLQLEDGERRTADFSPNTSLFDLVTSLAPTELGTLPHPTILYMRQEVTGEPALKIKTLRQLGLIKGRAILRLLNKAEEAKQANVSAVYRKPAPAEPVEALMKTEEHSKKQDVIPGPSNAHKPESTIVDPVKVIKEVKQKNAADALIIEKAAKQAEIQNKPVLTEDQTRPTFNLSINESKDDAMDVDVPQEVEKNSSTLLTQANLERRLKIEDEVTFLGAWKAVVFRQPEGNDEEMEDLPDDFYELTVEEVRKLYKDLQQNRLDLENAPLIPSNLREEMDIQSSTLRLCGYKNAVVRIQFPDHMVLQGVFSPTNTIEDITNFIKDHLRNPEHQFHIFTTPLKETLDPKMTLLEARFVPCVHMHFRWLEEDRSHSCLKEEVYLKQTPSDAASILASKYRAPTRRKADSSDSSSKSNVASSSKGKSSKVPSWFKN